MKIIKTAFKSTLIIDPEEKDNLNLISIFHENGLKLEIINQEQDYQAKIEKNKYDCVIISSDLANNNSEKIIDNLKINYPWIVIIILLENPSYEKIFSFIRMGVDDFILKPFIWEDFEKLLRFYYY